MRLTCIDDYIATSYDPQHVSLNEEMEGIVTFGDDWMNFYFQSDIAHDVLLELLQSMNDLYDTVDFPSIKQTPAFKNGMPCAARYNKDNRYDILLKLFTIYLHFFF